MPERVDMWKGVIIIGIVALVLAALVGGVYLWLMWPSSGRGTPGETVLTRQEQAQENINSLTAPAPSSTSAPGDATAAPKPAQTLSAPATASSRSSAQRQPGQGNINSLTAP